jgi:hypothetical protein|tara:strand:- start:1485 stop:1820 length:336 start_codon:yes stop_codon:yes gene_type:complete
MKESPIQATIGFVIDILGLRPENFDGAIETPAVISDIPGIEDLPPNAIDNVPEGGYGIFPLPPTNPGYNPGGISVLPPVNPGFPGYVPPASSGGRPQNPADVPDDIRELLG